ncbi:uncharacterized protein LODBEIA_P35740 [Lodderomyces beijingensis]|uniref:Transcription factor domain-containing protein n=1 Tax=Lodderomyces beijingensis TaxID=1775926 RepID=A0ABP0ZQ70_9ASCO
MTTREKKGTSSILGFGNGKARGYENIEDLSISQRTHRNSIDLGSTSSNGVNLVEGPRSEAPFSDSDLAKYDLPPWETLDKLINYYYIYNQPSQSHFPGKPIFLKNLALNIDASILHSIIATVCIIATRRDPALKINADEKYWIGKMHKFWDLLNDIGIIICYKTITRCLSIRFNMGLLNQVNIKIYETIYENNYVEIYSQSRFDSSNSSSHTRNPTFGTRRQIYEREIILKLVWSFYISNVILFRFNQGRPYYKLSSILDDFKFDYERDHYCNNMLLPLNEVDYMNLKLVNNRTSWKQLYERNHVPSDISSLILAAKMFEKLMSELSNGDLVFDNLVTKNDFNIDFTEKIKNQHTLVIEEKKLIVINITYWFANLILRTAEVVQYHNFITPGMKFKMTKYDFKRKATESDDPENSTPKQPMPLICEDILEMDDLTDNLKAFGKHQWISLIEVVRSMRGFVSLMEIAPSPHCKHYSAVIGPTLLGGSEIDDTHKTNFRDVISNSGDWWDSPELKASVKGSWNKLPSYALSFSTAFLSIACSLVALTKFIRLSTNPDSENRLNRLVVEFLKTGELVEIDYVVPEDYDIEKLFNQKACLNNVSALCEFIKYKLNYSPEELNKSTIQRMNKLTQYLDDILIA